MDLLKKDYLPKCGRILHELEMTRENSERCRLVIVYICIDDILFLK